MEIKSFNPAVLLEWLPDGHLEGNEFVALNPNREDRTKGSFKINVWNTSGPTMPSRMPRGVARPP